MWGVSIPPFKIKHNLCLSLKLVVEVKKVSKYPVMWPSVEFIHENLVIVFTYIIGGELHAEPLKQRHKKFLPHFIM
jgi:hypothetical protein